MANCLRWQAAHAYKKPDQAVILRLAESRLTASTCQVFNSDMRLKISDRVVMYPDVQAAACGKLRFEDGNEDVLLNPKLIVEVLSDSTASWTAAKVPALSSVGVPLRLRSVAQDAWLIEHYTRQRDGAWLLEAVEGRKDSCASNRSMWSCRWRRFTQKRDSGPRQNCSR